MVRIFRDKTTGDFVVQTTCLTPDVFLSELAEVLAVTLVASKKDGADLVALGILQNAMPIAYKLSGYKADEVSEQRTLVCGRASPASSDLIATAGR